MANRYRVEGRNMDGITGYFVVDTHHPYFKAFHDPNCYSNIYSQGLSMQKQEMIELAEKLNKEAAE